MSNDKDDEQMEFDLGTNDTNDTFTIDVSSLSDYSSDFGSYTVGPVDAIDTSFTFNTNFEEFVDTMPSMSKIKGMCEQYPAFNKEFEKFRQMYNLIKDDYETNNEDDLPF